MKAGVITIGDEILIGQIIDSNAAFIGSELSKIGISVYRIISISDNKEDIFKVLDELIPCVELVLITGGLGPTSDDITKPALAAYFKTRLVFNNGALDLITNFLNKRKVSINELNRNQAMLPENCIIVPNNSGTAMGMWFSINGKNIISMPGVPFEMKEMMMNFIIPRLSEIYNLPAILHKTVLTTGIAESTMAEKILNWESGLPENIKLAYLPSPGTLRLRLSATKIDSISTEEQVMQQIEILKSILGTAIFGYDDDTLEDVVGMLLTKNNSTLSVAESCTGGYISHLITTVPGASAYFKGGITAYFNGIKRDILNIDESILSKYGAVSEQVVNQMAEKVRNLMQSDYAIAVSGIAGPDGGTPDKPVGTVWISVSSDKGLFAKKFHFGDSRKRNIHRASMAGLNMLRLTIEGRQHET